MMRSGRRGWFGLAISLVAARWMAACGGRLAPKPTDECGAVLVLCSVGCAQETQATCSNGTWVCPPGLQFETPMTCPASSHACDGILLPLACSCDLTNGALSCDGG